MTLVKLSSLTAVRAAACRAGKSIRRLGLIGVLGAASVASLVTPAFAGCTVFQHRDFRGSHWGLDGGDWLMGACSEDQGSTSGGTGFCQPSWNDQISSYKVSRNCRAILFLHVINGSGGGSRFSRDFGVSVSYVGSAWNDQASWVQCICR